MGMDVFGRNPKSKKGEYFRANVWYWRPLWTMIQNLYPTYAEKVPYAHSNDGDGLNAEDSYALAELLQRDIESGIIKQYVDDYMEDLKSIPQDDCTYCYQTGFRLWPDSKTGLVTQSVCNACNGSTKVDNWATNYPMDFELVKEFQIFMKNSGGFSIC